MNRRPVVLAARLFFSFLTLAAIAAQLLVGVQRGFSVVNFFSYFTNLSNIVAALVMLVAAVYMLRRREPTPTEDVIRGASVAGMVVVGIVFSVLLRNEDLGALLPWVNTTLHYIMPVVVVMDWLFQPPRSNLAIGQIRFWSIFPLIYLGYTLVRGAVVGWYPYPFLNPANVGGYGGVLLYSLAIVVLFLLVSWVLIFMGNRVRAG
jgi:hypothetical protein